MLMIGLPVLAGLDGKAQQGQVLDYQVPGTTAAAGRGSGRKEVRPIKAPVSSR